DYSKEFEIYVESAGYELIGKYINTNTKTLIKCPFGHLYEVRPYSFKQGHKCPKCTNHCIEQTKERFLKMLNKEGYILLSEYKNSKTKVYLKCPNNHIYYVSPSHFINKKSRCVECRGLCRNKTKKDFIKSLSNEGYILLSEYKNSNTKVLVICHNRHVYFTTSDNFKSGRRCPKCSNHCPEQARESFLKLLKQEKYKLLSDYKNVSTKVFLECPEGHTWKVKPNDFSNYQRCPHCKGSTGQRKLQSMLESNTNHKMVYNDRTVLNGLELDIYFPELNIAIEYQGDYWHSIPETVERDKRKKQLCEEIGIKLIEVWDSEFIKEEQIVYNDIIYIIKNQETTLNEHYRN
ncbi:MAG TPA: hypothetical protein VK982_10850, partial [Bacteroidales bacterium]|nr:hypothetical protein [Bacteroidales bacterium]